jgi:hypothetical protein
VPVKFINGQYACREKAMQRALAIARAYAKANKMPPESPTVRDEDIHNSHFQQLNQI